MQKKLCRTRVKKSPREIYSLYRVVVNEWDTFSSCMEYLLPHSEDLQLMEHPFLLHGFASPAVVYRNVMGGGNFIACATL
jgi:hypothetical protein